MSEWRPIETAPKDGTAFLAWCDAVYGEVSGFMDGLCFITQLAGEPDDRSDAEISGCSGPWWIDGGDYYGCWSRPTHWMPLPDPPIAERPNPS